MAKSNNNPEKTSVTRIKASDDKPVTKKQSAKVSTPKKVIVTNDGEAKQGFFKRLIAYFKGAWFELKQVRWPNRKATWGMTAALLIFTALFTGFILAADLLWENIFKLILGQ